MVRDDTRQAVAAAGIGGLFDRSKLSEKPLARYLLPDRTRVLYVGDYLKEEVAAEGLVRKLPVFSEFLAIAALSDGDLVNCSNIARGCSVEDKRRKLGEGILMLPAKAFAEDLWRGRIV